MTMNEYQALAQRTSPDGHDRILNGVLGLAGESGECADIVKKATFQGHPKDREHLLDECSDVLWYVAELAAGLGVTLEDVAQHNIEKLRKRYPEGFDPERSQHREAEQPVGKADTSETLEEMARRLCIGRECVGDCPVHDVWGGEGVCHVRHMTHGGCTSAAQIAALRKWAAENPPERER